jgi:hypothetical protein
MADAAQEAGDPLPPACTIIEVRVAELKQLFNSMDPSPFLQKDLDPDAEEFIVGWAREAPRGARLALVVHLDRGPGPGTEASALGEAMKGYFDQRAEATRRRLRYLLRVGRISLAIGLLFVAACVGAGDLLAERFKASRIGGILQESFLIGGWVAMWRPLEIFLYDWWPIRAEIRLFERLAEMPVRVVYTGRGASDAWRADWPAVPVETPAR